MAMWAMWRRRVFRLWQDERQKRAGGGGPTINLSSATIAEDASVGDLVGTLSVSNGTGTYAFTLTDDAGGLFAIDLVDDTLLEVAAALNYETATSHSITIEADNGVDPVLTRSFTITVTNVLEITLSALTLNTSEINEGSAEDTAVGTLQSVTSGSTLSLFDDAGGQFKLSGSDIVAGATATNWYTEAAPEITVRETHADGSNSPRDSVIAITVLDITAPILASPDVDTITETTATVHVTTNEASGTLYTVVTTSATDPSKAQIKAGQDHTGAAAVFAGNQAIVSSGLKSFSVTGLTGATTYYVYFMHEDASANQSNVVSFDAWATSGVGAPGAPVIAFVSNGGGRTPVFTVSGLGAAGAIAGDTVRIYTFVDPTGISFVEYVNDIISAGDITADEITISGVTLLSDALYQAHARIENGIGLGDLSNEEEFTINTALTLTALFGPEVDYSTGFNFLIEGDLQDNDRIVIEADQDSAFGSVDDDGSTIYSGGIFGDDSPVNALGPLANGLTYFRAYRERAASDDSDYSNIESTTISATLTAAERMSAPHLMLPWRGVYPIPDSTIAVGDRQAAANLYSGV